MTLKPLLLPFYFVARKTTLQGHTHCSISLQQIAYSIELYEWLCYWALHLGPHTKTHVDFILKPDVCSIPENYVCPKISRCSKLCNHGTERTQARALLLPWHTFIYRCICISLEIEKKKAIESSWTVPGSPGRFF